MKWLALTLLIAIGASIFANTPKDLRGVSGVASWYGERYRGKPTASGELFDPDAMTAAHRELPFGTRVKCTLGARSVVVTINDRGPFIEGRIIDLSRGAFAKLAHTDAGLIKVKLEIIN